MLKDNRSFHLGPTIVLPWLRCYKAPIEGYEDAIVVPPINANNFELKQPLINLVQSNKFTGRQDPHNHWNGYLGKDEKRSKNDKTDTNGKRQEKKTK
ncbi:hypothetical protein Tco_0017515 [Tanacetum coccineum]